MRQEINSIVEKSVKPFKIAGLFVVDKSKGHIKSIKRTRRHTKEFKLLSDHDKKIFLVQRGTSTSFKIFTKPHNKLRAKYGWYHAWHSHPHHRKVHFGVLATSMAGFAMLMFSVFGFPHFGHAAEVFRANFDSGSLNADYSVGTGIASDDGTPADITTPGYNSTTGAVTVSAGQTLKYSVANNLDTAKGEIEMKFQLPYDLNGDQSTGLFFGNAAVGDYDPASEYIYVADYGNNRIVKTKIDGTGWETFGTFGAGAGQFSAPSDVFYDSASDYLYIADTSNNRIIKTKFDGTSWTTYGSSGAGVGKFGVPSGIFYDASTDYIYVADTNNERIVKTKIDGTGWTTYGSVGSGVGQFASNALYKLYYDSASDYIYATDSGNSRIVKTKIDGTGWTTYGSSGSGIGNFNVLLGIYYDSVDDYIFVCDTNNSRIVKTKIDGTGWITYSTSLVTPRGMAYDSSTGFIYTYDSLYSRITKTKIDGTGKVLFGSKGKYTGQTLGPNGIYYDASSGSVLTTDISNRIVRQKMDGSNWAKYGNYGSSGNGTFYLPRGFYYDSATEFYYIADTTNARIVKTKIDGTGYTTYSGGKFSAPSDIDYDPATDFFYIIDADKTKIIKTKLDANWTGFTNYGAGGSGVGQFSNPRGIDFDPATGFVYVADTNNERIVKTQLDGSWTGWTTYGTLGTGNGQFGNNGIFDVAYDSASQYIYVADAINHRIVKTQIDGTGWTSLGGTSAGSDTGQFNNPYSVSYDAASSFIYVADYTNNRIVKTQIDGTGWTTWSGDEERNLLRTSGTYPMSLSVNAADGRFKFYISQNGLSYEVQSTPQTFAQSTWHTIKTTYNNSSGVVSILLDGTEIASKTFPAWAAPDVGGSFYIGSDPLAANSYKALGKPIDEIKLTSIATDNTAPVNPSALIVKNQAGGSQIADQTNSGSWYNHSSPQFTWPAATDDDSGVEGYFVYFGTSNDAAASDPQTQGTWQTGTSYVPTGLVDGQTYYLKIKTRDNAYNVSSVWDAFTYKYDATSPTAPESATVSPVNYTKTNNFTFAWAASSDNSSGIKSYEYKTGASEGEYSDWQETDAGETSSRALSKSDIAYQDGTNIFYLRGKDNAGNVSEQFTVNFYYGVTAPNAPTSLTASPETSFLAPAMENSFRFTWAAPSHYAGIAGYHYSINEEPNESNTNTTAATATVTDHFATQKGDNTFYVVAEDIAGNIDYSHFASVHFYCSSEAPGAPTNVQTFDASNRDTHEYAATVKWTKPADVGDNFVGYDVYRSDREDPVGTVTSVNNTIYSETNLESVEYTYSIKTRDSLGQVSAASSPSTITPTGKYTDPPHILSGPTVTFTSGTLSANWVTDRESSTLLAIYDQDGQTIPSISPQASAGNEITHSVTIKHLSPSTNYKYQITSTDIDGNTYESEKIDFQTADPGDISPTPTVTSGTISLNWTTSTASNASFEVLDKEGNAFDPPLSKGLITPSTNHEFKMTGLTPGTDYQYFAQSTDADGNFYTSGKISFKTLSPTSIIGADVKTAADKLVANWQTNDESNSLVYIYEEGKENDPSYTGSAAVLSKTHSITVSGLMPQTTYKYLLESIDKDGNVGRTPSLVEFSTTLAPAIYVTATDPSLTSIVLNVTATTNGNFKVLYGPTSEYGKTTESYSVDTTKATSVRLAELTDGTRYYYHVAGADSVGNTLQNDGYFDTPASPKISDVQYQPVADAPSTTYDIYWKTNVPTSSNITFSASGKANKISSKADLEKDHVLRIKDLEDQSTYSVNVTGRDQFGNEATYSASEIKTPLDSRPPKVSNLTVEVKSSGFGTTQKASVIVSWETDELTTSQVEYAQGISGTDYSNKSKEDTALSNSHVVILGELEPSKIYHLRAISHDSAGNLGNSDDTTVITGKMQNSVLDIIINSLEKSLGWMFRIFGN